VCTEHTCKKRTVQQYSHLPRPNCIRRGYSRPRTTHYPAPPPRTEPLLYPPFFQHHSQGIRSRSCCRSRSDLGRQSRYTDSSRPHHNRKKGRSAPHRTARFRYRRWDRPRSCHSRQPHVQQHRTRSKVPQ